MNSIAPRLLLSFLLCAAAAGYAFAQECGPGCPACSGKTIGDLQSPATITITGLYIPDGEEETAVHQLRYGLTPWLDVGLGYAHQAKETIWSVRAQVVAQDSEGWRPAVILGTGSVQTGGSDQSGYIQLAKTTEIVEGRLGASLAGGYATDFPDATNDWWLGTVSLTLYDRVSPFYTYDGINSHLGLSWFATDWLTLSGYSLEMEQAALSATVQWPLGEKDEE